MKVEISEIVHYENHPDHFGPKMVIHGQDALGNDYFGKIAWIKKPTVNAPHEGFDFMHDVSVFVEGLK